MWRVGHIMPVQCSYSLFANHQSDVRTNKRISHPSDCTWPIYSSLYCSLYNDLRNDWIRNITDKTPDFVEMDTTTKLKLIFAIHHRITAKFILRSYNVRKENLFR